MHRRFKPSRTHPRRIDYLIRGGGMGRKRLGYTKNSTLGVRRPPSAFSLYLKSVAGSMPTFKKRRLCCKRSIWRMDLLQCKFAGLSATERKPLDDLAAASLASARASRDVALRSGVSQVAPSAAVAAAAAQPSAPSAAVAAQPAAPSAAVAAGTCHVWMQVEVPHGAPELVAASASDPVLAHVQCRVSWPALGGVEHTLESIQCGAVGRGSYGACLIVRNPATGETMVAKVATGKTQRDRVCVKTALRTEFAAMYRMTHPNVVRAFALVNVVPGPDIALLMPQMAGNLWEWILRRPEAADASAVAGPHDTHLPFVQRSVVLQVAAGVAHIHSRHIVHCDLKPDNVLVDRLSDTPDRGGGGVRCQVADFGVCQAMVDIEGVPSAGRVQADEVNTVTYRPFWLFRLDGWVFLSPLFDVWALAGIIFDVAQAPQHRLRNRDGEFIRFMTGVTMSGKEPAYKAMCLERNRRVMHHARPCVRSIILAAQPPTPSKHGPTAADVAHRLLKLQCPPCRDSSVSHSCAAVATKSAVAANSAVAAKSPAASLLL
jgi:hypothetical protein